MEEENVMETMARLDSVVAERKAVTARLAEQQVAPAAAAEERVGRMTATVESPREAELERRLAEAEAELAELKAGADPQGPLRQTLPAGVATMLSKQGVAMEGEGVSMQAAALDAALAGLSIEQRIAVKAEMLRAGLLR